MYHELPRHASFWAFLFSVDQDLAEQARQKKCPCGGCLHRANYPRKPRGGGDDLPAEYGCRLGLAFQITDDLLDVQGDEQAVGKRLQKDAKDGKLTFPGLLGVEASLRRAEQLVTEACDALEALGRRAQGLRALARYVLERNR